MYNHRKLYANAYIFGYVKYKSNLTSLPFDAYLMPHKFAEYTKSLCMQAPEDAKGWLHASPFYSQFHLTYINTFHSCIIY